MSGAGERARLFVALDLDVAARDALAVWCEEIVDAQAGLRAVRPEALHVTLCFLGACAVAEVEAIAGACAAAAAAAEPVAGLALGAACWLPPRRPRVLAVAVQDGAGTLAAGQAVLSDALAAGGWYRPERRPFFAHVSVARVVGGAGGARPREQPPPPPALPLAAGASVTLYRSRLSPKGARYEALASVVPGSGGAALH